MFGGPGYPVEPMAALPDPASSIAAAPSPARAGALHRVRAYVMLTKPRVIELLLVTTVPSMVLAEQGWPSLGLVLAVLLGGTLAAGGANTINCFIERDRDQVMQRTHARPLPQGEVSPVAALVFGLALEVFAFVWLTVTANLLAAALAVSATLFYVFVYTIWLKPRSDQNIVIGGAAGAVPVLVGWAAVTGSLAAPAWVLFAVIFLWTPPHFWALALYRKLEYAKAGVPMLPVTHGDQFTRLHVFFYTIILFAVTMLPYATHMSGLIYVISAIVLGGVFLYYAIRIYRDYSDSLARTTFRYSILYLTLLFAALLIDHYITL